MAAWRSSSMQNIFGKAGQVRLPLIIEQENQLQRQSVAGEFSSGYWQIFSDGILQWKSFQILLINGFQLGRPSSFGVVEKENNCPITITASHQQRIYAHTFWSHSRKVSRQSLALAQMLKSGRSSSAHTKRGRQSGQRKAGAITTMLKNGHAHRRWQRRPQKKAPHRSFHVINITIS